MYHSKIFWNKGIIFGTRRKQKSSTTAEHFCLSHLRGCGNQRMKIIANHNWSNDKGSQKICGPRDRPQHLVTCKPSSNRWAPCKLVVLHQTAWMCTKWVEFKSAGACPLNRAWSTPQQPSTNIVGLSCQIWSLHVKWYDHYTEESNKHLAAWHWPSLVAEWSTVETLLPDWLAARWMELKQQVDWCHMSMQRDVMSISHKFGIYFPSSFPRQPGCLGIVPGLRLDGFRRIQSIKPVNTATYGYIQPSKGAAPVEGWMYPYVTVFIGFVDCLLHSKIHLVVSPVLFWVSLNVTMSLFTCMETL